MSLREFTTELRVAFQDEEEDVYKRDFSAPTLEDHFNKTILPKVMQVSCRSCDHVPKSPLWSHALFFLCSLYTWAIMCI